MEILDNSDKGLVFAKASVMPHMSALDANLEKCPWLGSLEPVWLVMWHF